jgi:5-methylcytosine-specific restriction endonuclease McrA
LKRIQAARAARRFPALFTALAEGRLHLAGVCLLAPHLTAENSDGLLESAAHRRKSEIEELLARRFPVPGMVWAMPALLPQHAPGHVGFDPSNHGDTCNTRPAPAPPQAEGAAPPERFLLQLTIGTSTRDKLRYAQALLSHAVPSGDVASVLDRALDALITQLEKRKAGVGTGAEAGTRRPRRRCSTAGTRYVPAHVRRGVWERDQGQCTFVGATGHRCQSRRFLEFDHMDPVARGGEATVGRMRLRCRAHNQYEAERVFGAGFMSRKRYEARLAAAEARLAAAPARARADAEEQDAREQAAREQAAREQARNVLAGLRNLGCKAEEARRAVAFTETLQGATLEERMRGALQFLSRKLDRHHARGGVRYA